MRQTSGLDDLYSIVRKHRIGVIIVTPADGPAPTMLVVLGIQNQTRPFTYPEVRQLQQITELIDSLLIRSRLTEQSNLEARIEHLGIMSRGLAHDLKNLITPVSSFLVHTDNHFPRGSIEAEVHIDARRSMRVMTEYVREALLFSEQLAPRFQQVDVEDTFKMVQQLSNGRAVRRGVVVSTDWECDDTITADGVLLQRLLVNLVGNAVDASKSGQRVTLTGRKAQLGWLRIQVTDEGCGIAPENLERIFEPYFTTKQFGEDIRGFGLGLTICQKIVQVHGGSIGVKSELGEGTTFTVDLPISPAIKNPEPQPAQSVSAILNSPVC